MKKISNFLGAVFLLWTAVTQAQPGNPDPTFANANGFTTMAFYAGGHAYPNAVAIQPNGRIVVAGETWVPDGQSNSALAITRYMPNGAPDPTFSVGGKNIITLDSISIAANAVSVLSDGKILCAGSAWTTTSSYFMATRLKPDGALDLSFGNNGFTITKVANFNQGGIGIAVQPDGKFIVAGFSNTSGYDDFTVLRYKSNGILDNTFGGGDGIVITPLGESNSTANSVLLQPDGKIVVAGFAVSNGYQMFALVRYKPDGSLDNAFSGDGKATVSFTAKNDRGNSIAIQPDGKIVMVGYAGATGTPSDVEIAVARFNINGTMDPSFGGGDGLVMVHASNYADAAKAVLIQPDGKILIGGASSNSQSTYHFNLVRLLTNGTPDSSFGSNGIATLPISPTNDGIIAMCFQPDGKVVAIGNAWFDNLHKFAVARFLTGVSVDTTIPDVFSSAVSLYPNPIQDQATLEYELKSTENITIDLYDIQNRFLQNLIPRSEKSSGKHQEVLQFNKSILSGTYLIEIESDRGTTIVKAVF